MTRQAVNIIKVGGKIVEEPATLARLLDDIAAMSGAKVLVHGGGRSATALAGEMGVPVTMIDGRRVTDAAMLRIVTMVYGGLVNKQIVASLQARGVNAIGLTGADMDLVRAHRRPAGTVDWGYVGDVDSVDPRPLAMLIDGGYTPVVAPLSHDGRGSMLNTNADTIASTVACALAAAGRDVTLTYCFEMPGVLVNPDDPASVIPEINPAEYARLRQLGIVSGGMVPKLDNAFAAIDAGVSRVVITAASALTRPDAGTTIKR